jgi:long-subunit fatty acid transport protein
MKSCFQALIVLVVFSLSVSKLRGQDDYRQVKPPSTGVAAKEEAKIPFKDKLFFGGNLGLQFGAITFIDISPLIGYRINKKFSVGVGITYQYLRRKDAYYNFETNVYGGRMFGRYFMLDNLFVQGELEYLNLEAFDLYYKRRVDVFNVLGGVGYFQRFAQNSGVVAMILYNFNQSFYTPYSNPVIRIGVNLGF